MLSIAQAEALQTALAQNIVKKDSGIGNLPYIGGVDVAYEKGGDRVIAAITVLATDTLKLVETSTFSEKFSFPYIPGLFSFRELPPVLKAWEQLKTKPGLVVCDGQGYAHPRRFGLACHLGVELDIPTIGCAKTRLIGTFDMPGLQRGCATDLIDQSEVIGKVLRTQDNTKPVFVSVGHKVCLETACNWVLKLSPEFRLPETTRSADHAVNMAMKELSFR